VDNYYVIVYRRGMGALIITRCVYITDPDDPEQTIFTVHALKPEAGE
jgi:hypothetical protein